MFSARRVLLRASLLTFVLLVPILLLSTCSGTGGTAGKSPSDVTDVGTVTPTALAASGVLDANVPTDITGIKAAFNSIPTDDALPKDLDKAFTDIGDQLSSPAAKTSPAAKVLGKAVLAFGGILHKSLGTSIQTQVDKIATDLENFPTSKSLDETIDLSGSLLGNYVMLTTATGNLTASVTTTDGGALADGMSNFKTGKGQVTVSLTVDPNNLPPLSVFKGFQAKVNAGAAVQVGGTTTNSYGDVIPTNITYDYGESAVFAISLNSGGYGGKFVMTANAKNSGTTCCWTMWKES